MSASADYENYEDKRNKLGFLVGKTYEEFTKFIENKGGKYIVSVYNNMRVDNHLSGSLVYDVLLINVIYIELKGNDDIFDECLNEKRDKIPKDAVIVKVY